MYGCLDVFMCPMYMQKVLEIRKGIESSKTGVTDSCELRVGAGNKIQILCKINKCSQLLSLLSSTLTPPLPSRKF